MIIIKKLSKSVLKQTLFRELSLTIQKGDKVGIVGPNGGGKTTLLKIIAGFEPVDEGVIETEKERIGYLAQDQIFTENETVGSFLSAAKHRVYKVLSEVQLTVGQDDIVNQLSGGQKTKLALAKLLLENPSVILLDEPTNHLDQKAIDWLIKFINKFKGVVVLVSHDRQLLNRTVTKIIEIDPVSLEVNEFIGNYDTYIEEKAVLVEKRQGAYILQEKKRKKMEEWIRNRQDIASAIPNPSMGKQIQMMKRRLQREIRDNEINQPGQYIGLRNKSLSGNVPSAKLILRAKNLTLNFIDREILSNINFEIRGSDRIAILGDNGSGKTTLLRLLISQLAPSAGTLEIGSNLNIGYFDQDLGQLDLSKTVEQELLSTYRLDLQGKSPRSFLGSFLFRGDEVFKKVSDLSLGQRVRLIFAKLMSQNNQLLVLDEPTNHLDIISKESIEQALKEYQGSLLVVSHDQYFLDKIAINIEYELKLGKLRKL